LWGGQAGGTFGKVQLCFSVRVTRRQGHERSCPMARRAERKRPRGRTSRSELQRRTRARESTEQARKATCPVVVGMGASAGGLEAFIRFFRTMAPDSGMAFVVIQHLDPT